MAGAGVAAAPALLADTAHPHRPATRVSHVRVLATLPAVSGGQSAVRSAPVAHWHDLTQLLQRRLTRSQASETGCLAGSSTRRVHAVLLPALPASQPASQPPCLACSDHRLGRTQGHDFFFPMLTPIIRHPYQGCFRQMPCSWPCAGPSGPIRRPRTSLPTQRPGRLANQICGTIVDPPCMWGGGR